MTDLPKKRCKPSPVRAGCPCKTRVPTALRESVSFSRVAPDYSASLASAIDPDTMTRAELRDYAWAAGMTDGEGCISAVWQRFHESGRRPTMRVRFMMGQNDLHCLQRLQSILGCKDKIYRVKRRAVENRQLYSFILDGAHALAAIAKLAPFLVRKKPEADYLLSAVERCWLGNRPGPAGFPEHVWTSRDQLVKKLQRLK